jgi:hypothetical protein
MTLRDGVPTTMAKSVDGEKQAGKTASKEKGEGEKDIEVTAVEEGIPAVDLECLDGGWRAWGVVIGVSGFLQWFKNVPDIVYVLLGCVHYSGDVWVCQCLGGMSL